jgi:hypothetical protein
VFTAPLHSNVSYSTIACVFVVAGMYLPSRCLAMNVYSDVTIPAFRHHVTLWQISNSENDSNKTTTAKLNVDSIRGMLVTNQFGPFSPRISYLKSIDYSTPVVLHGCETSSLATRVFENRVCGTTGNQQGEQIKYIPGM